MISSCQIKSARGLLGWSAAELAKASGVGIATIRRYELQDGIPSANAHTLRAIEDAFRSVGVEFIGDPLNDPGVKLRRKSG